MALQCVVKVCLQHSTVVRSLLTMSMQSWNNTMTRWLKSLKSNLNLTRRSQNISIIGFILPYHQEQRI
uniref:Uncharacterized protein n=1 Tax=Arundo donax TaxID=35708 RepID=A0A0A9AY28_ARUDO